MKFEDSSLTGYLVKHLRPLTPADPAILAEYVVALLKKDKPTEELQKLCTDNLVDFLGHSTNSFITNLFQALEDSSLIRPVDNTDPIKKSEISPPVAVDSLELKTLSSKEEEKFQIKKEQEHSSSSGPATDPEDQEVSDDDDDRNHKHRKRDTQPQSFDEGDQGHFLRRPCSKRNNTYDNVQLFLGTRPPREIKKEYNPSLERDPYLKFEKRHPNMALLPKAPVDLSQRTRMSQALRNDPGPRFDSTSLARPPSGRGRGRGAGSWSQHDTRFSPLGTLDFVSHMAPQGPNHPSMFVGTGLPSAASTQSASWGTFGFIPGMPNGCFDPLHPLSLQGTLHSSMNPQLNLSMPRQRCRDFEEQGFCLRGDMCPMEHGVNRIVVEDVQSLSQFNLPVSLPTTHSIGLQPGSGTAPTTTSSSFLTNSKSLPCKSSKIIGTDDENRVLSSSAAAAGGESDVYDPDQPLWNNDNPETSNGLLGLPPSKVDDAEPLWDVEPSDHNNFKISDNIGSERPSSSSAGNIGSERRNQTGHKNKSKMATNSIMTAAGYPETETMGSETVNNAYNAQRHGRFEATEESDQKDMAPFPRFRKDSRRNTARTSQKALRTLFVNGIPQKNNKKEALISHFKKFGEVIDIYIPQNSEKAFLQFSKREEAEAALNAPDAVMGNRFIKLFWANRDSVVDGKEVNAVATSTATWGRVASSVPFKPSATSEGKESLPSTAPKASSAPASDISTVAAVQSKALPVNTAKAAPLTQKKRESLELLKEELRKKQEMLAQKRNEFRNQLDKLEKKAAIVNKCEAPSQHAVKKQKTDKISETPKASNQPANCVTLGEQPDAVKTLDKSSSADRLALPSSKADSSMQQQSPTSSARMHNLVIPSVNRFKLDNRPTGFRILPPLPAGFANVAALKEHFSMYDLTAVELDDPEANSGSECLTSSPSCSARVSFTTRRSAERAFMSGKFWQGHSLQFAWLTTSSNSSNDNGAQQVSAMNSEGVLAAGLQPKPVNSESSLPNAGVTTCSVISETINASDSGDHMDVDGSGSVCKSPTEAQSSLTLSSSEKQPTNSGAPIVEDGASAVSAQRGYLANMAPDFDL